MDARLGRLGRLAARRLVEAVPLLLIVSAVAFTLLQLVPGGPLEVYLSNPGVRPEDLDRLRRALGLDRPLTEQYVRWIAAFVRGDWGYSFSDGRPVLTRVAERLPASLELLGASFLLAVLAALPSGLAAAVRQGRGADRVLSLMAAVGVSVPAFWLGLMLQLVFAIGLGWLPSSGRAAGHGIGPHLASLALPATVLAVVHASAWMRYLRASTIEVLRAPFVSAARARGVDRARQLLRHALPNALAPVATVILLDAALLVPGAVVTESVFAWPGIGSLFTEALGRRDFPVLLALLMASAVAVVLFSLVADLLHAWLDPRVTA